MVDRNKVACLALTNQRVSSTNATLIRFAMKLSSAVTPRTGLRSVAASVIFCAILVHISAMDDSLTGGPQGGDQNYNRVSADSANTGEKQSLLYRGQRAVKNNNATPSPNQEFEKRLKAMEERYNFVFP